MEKKLFIHTHKRIKNRYNQIKIDGGNEIHQAKILVDLDCLYIFVMKFRNSLFNYPFFSTSLFVFFWQQEKNKRLSGFFVQLITLLQQ